MTGRITLGWPIKAPHFSALLCSLSWKKKNAARHLDIIWIRNEHKYGELSGFWHAKWNISINYVSLENSQNVTRHSQKLMKWIKVQVDSLKDKVNVVVLILVAVYSILFFESTIIDLLSFFQLEATVNNLTINILYKNSDSHVPHYFYIT